MKELLEEDECNDTYSRIRMYQALTLKQPENVDIPSERTVYRIDELRTIIWRYFISYWNNRRICSVNGGFPPMTKRQQYYDSLKGAA